MSEFLELNMRDVKRDADFHVEKGLSANSPIVEIFSRMVNGQEIGEIKDRNGKKVDVNNAVNYIKGLAHQAGGGNQYAATELNEIRTYVIWPLIQRRFNQLRFLGQYENIPYTTTPVMKEIGFVGAQGRAQANRGDVTFGSRNIESYPVKTRSVAAGHIIDYRMTAAGDMRIENELVSRIEIDLWNKLLGEIVGNLYNEITSYNGVAFTAHGNGVAKSGVDWIINSIRRFGPVTAFGDQAVTSQFGAFLGWAGITPVLPATPAPSPATVTAQGISQALVTEYLTTGFIGTYNGANIVTIDNPYNLSAPTTDSQGRNTYETLFPQGYLFFIPTGYQSPVHNWIIGNGVTSFMGHDVETGSIMTRFDLMFATAVAKSLISTVGLYIDDTLVPAA